jgi:hypothetical protein
MEIFDCYMIQAEDGDDYSLEVEAVEAWHSLVHVSKMAIRCIWVTTPPESPTSLPGETPLKERLLSDHFCPSLFGGFGNRTRMDNTIAALEHNERIRKIDLSDVTGVLAAVQQPFSALTDLAIWLVDHETAPVTVIPDSFWNGSARRLRMRHLDLSDGIPSPGLPSTTFVCHWPFPTPSLENSPFRVHYTQSDGPMPLCDDEDRR